MASFCCHKVFRNGECSDSRLVVAGTGACVAIWRTGDGRSSVACCHRNVAAGRGRRWTTGGFLNGMLYVLRVGCSWRDMHERYGKWNSVYVRVRRWAERGVWDALLQTLVDLGLTDDWQHMIDSTRVCGHSQAAGAKGGLIRRALVEAAAALRAKSTLARTVRDALSASCRPAERPPTTSLSRT